MSRKATSVGDMSEEDKAFMVACVDMTGRLGAETFELRWDDNEGIGPVVWFGLAKFRKQSPIQRGVTVEHWEAAAAMHPRPAMFRLLELLMDGGKCKHCGRMSGVTDSVDTMPWNSEVCWYQYDPELNTFRRGCEGDRE